MASGCIHTRQARNKEILAAYKLAVKLARTRNKKTFKCEKCDHLGLVRVCLNCPFIGCQKHIKEHSKEEGKKQHNLSVDTSGEGMVYCSECDDYVVDDTFEAMTKAITNGGGAGSGSGGSGSGGIGGGNVNKLPKVKGMGILPPYQATTGLRGFCNMGATCFMSVVLQVLIHNPLVRNFFLSGGHERNQCQREYCIACCIDDMFVEFFKSNSVVGYGPTQLLVASWKQKRALAGASEQDAHEFLQFVLDEFHQSHFESMVLSKVENGQDHNTPGSEVIDMSCGCVAHRTFCGELESRITCKVCGNVTRTVDPMMDLSLEVKNIKNSTSSKKGIVKLEDCLDKFTSTERLDAMYHCKTCMKRQSVDKQLKMKRLPFVLSIQLKRFEHTTVQGTKIETPVQFPLFLDMSRYTNVNNGEEPLSYELFGVVCHQGSINTGHYTSYMKDRFGRWYYFDDAIVTSVSPKVVLNATVNAYLLFYIIERI